MRPALLGASRLFAPELGRNHRDRTGKPCAIRVPTPLGAKCPASSTSIALLEGFRTITIDGRHIISDMLRE